MAALGRIVSWVVLPVGLVAVVVGCGEGDLAGVGEGDGDQWTTYTSEKLKFSVDMPGEPKVSELRIGFNNNLEQGGFETGIFNVFIGESEVPEAVLDAHLKLSAARYPGDYVDQAEEYFEWKGHRAYRVKARGPGDQSDVCVQNVTVHVNGITYALGVMGYCESMDEDVERFRDSFELLDRDGNGE